MPTRRILTTPTTQSPTRMSREDFSQLCESWISSSSHQLSTRCQYSGNSCRYPRQCLHAEEPVDRAEQELKDVVKHDDPTTYCALPQ